MAKARKKLDAGTILDQGIQSLGQVDQTWEIDVRALPESLSQSETQYLGLVVNKDDGSLLVQSQVEGRPKVGDLSALLTVAMLRPLVGKGRCPRRLHVRGHRQWQELIPPLEELGIQVSVRKELPKAKTAFQRELERIREARRSEMVRPSKQQAIVENLFPAIANWVQGCGHIEIGDQESYGFTVRAIDDGGVVFEDDKAETLAEAMATLEQGLANYFEQEEIE
ncbi:MULTISPECIES: DUF6930 domain-containing protein [unclassified Schlesneria]|uniref:DUF6930 domain-containing protein n=2 Tax=Planctomycetaceae TaxID=126 RepID=UPI0035A12A95